MSDAEFDGDDRGERERDRERDRKSRSPFDEFYATRKGIDLTLAMHGLKGLCDIAEARCKAGYGDHKRLPEFLVLGRFWFDTCGNIALIRDAYVGSDDRGLEKVLRSMLTKVLSGEELKQLIPGLHWSASLGFALPREEDLCEECGAGWTLDNCDDAVNRQVNRKREIFHHLCLALNIERDAAGYYGEIFKDAGLGEINTDRIPNEYWKDEGPPWFILRTPKGNLKVGHRKRVFHVEWTDLLPAVKDKLDTNVLFPDENVTKGQRYIHAWGREKAVEYLRTVAKVAKIGDFKRTP